MQIIYDTADYTDALIKKGLLEQAGFLVHMDNENASSTMPYLGLAVGLRLWVPDSEATQAKALVSDKTLHEDLPANGNAIDECPDCGSWQVVRHRSLLWLPLFLISDVLMAPVGGRHRTCQDCGRKYKKARSHEGWPIHALAVVALVYVLTLIVVWFRS